MLSFEPDKSRFILIGNSEFPNDRKFLPSLPAVKNNVLSLRSLLIDPGYVGAPESTVIELLDRGSVEIARVLAEEARAARDLLFVYYSGHGIIGKSKYELFLAVKETQESSAEYTALEFAKVKLAIEDSVATTKVLILDCCYSGMGIDAMSNATSSIRASIEFESKGTLSIASASRNQAAIAPEGAKHTAFTGIFLKHFSEGIENDKEYFTLGELYDSVESEIKKSSRFPKPEYKQHSLDAKQFIFSKNNWSWTIAKRRFPELLQDLDNIQSRSQDIQSVLSRIDFELPNVQTEINSCKQRIEQLEDQKITKRIEKLEDQQNSFVDFRQLLAFQEGLDSWEQRIKKLEDQQTTNSHENVHTEKERSHVSIESVVVLYLPIVFSILYVSLTYKFSAPIKGAYAISLLGFYMQAIAFTAATIRYFFTTTIYRILKIKTISPHQREYFSPIVSITDGILLILFLHKKPVINIIGLSFIGILCNISILLISTDFMPLIVPRWIKYFLG